MDRNRFYVPLVVLFLALGTVIYLSGRQLPDVVEKKLINLQNWILEWK